MGIRIPPPSYNFSTRREPRLKAVKLKYSRLHAPLATLP